MVDQLATNDDYFNPKSHLGMKDRHAQLCTFKAMQIVWSRKARQLGSGITGADDPLEIGWRLLAAYMKEDLLKLWEKTKDQTED